MTKNLREIAIESFDAVLQAVDARQAVRDTVEADENRLKIGVREFPVDKFSEIYAIAIGKAGESMALGLSEKLSGRIKGGIISAPALKEEFPPHWEVFRGGHPYPNEESIKAAIAAKELLKEKDGEKTLIIFLISGGGSAMFDLPAKGVSPEDLKAANHILVNCGAMISEVNSVRRRLSQVKGGGLARFAPKAEKITLIISDTNVGEPENVASGPTINSIDDGNRIEEIIRKYNLAEKLPSNVLRRLKMETGKTFRKHKNHDYFVLLDNRNSIEAARNFLSEHGFATAITEDLTESVVDLGCTELLNRLIDMRRLIPRETPIALISGGEFTCPLRGDGIGGRNLESALRTAILFDELGKRSEFAGRKLTALFAGTDGIDGNSPAAGAICDETTICRASAKDLSAQEFLERSDSYRFFEEIDDLVVTGASGTNVRDIRILLAQ